MAGLFVVKVLSTDDRFGYANPFFNMYGYRSNLAVIDEANNLADAFIATMVPVIADVMSSQAVIQSLEVFELNGTQYAVRASTPLPVRGTRTGDPMPIFVAWAFKYIRASLGERSGAKRIGSVSESDVTNGAATAGAATPLNALAAVMGAPIQFGIIDTWFPVILERPVPPSTIWGDHPVGSVVYQAVSTQNSRKT